MCRGYGSQKYTLSNNFQKLDHEEGWPSDVKFGGHNSEPPVMLSAGTKEVPYWMWVIIFFLSSWSEVLRFFFKNKNVLFKI